MLQGLRGCSQLTGTAHETCTFEHTVRRRVIVQPCKPPRRAEYEHGRVDRSHLTVHFRCCKASSRCHCSTTCEHGRAFPGPSFPTYCLQPNTPYTHTPSAFPLCLGLDGERVRLGRHGRMLSKLSTSPGSPVPNAYREGPAELSPAGRMRFYDMSDLLIILNVFEMRSSRGRRLEAMVVRIWPGCAPEGREDVVRRTRRGDVYDIVRMAPLKPDPEAWVLGYGGWYRDCATVTISQIRRFCSCREL